MPIRSAEPSVEARETIARLKDAFAILEDDLIKSIPNSRERALALTNLEQASMWATKALCQPKPSITANGESATYHTTASAAGPAFASFDASRPPVLS